jgi:hypothetical protein
VSPTGGTSSRLSSIQAAVERAPARAGRAALRFGLRALVVAGFAGAAWLLYANAAQAADAPVTDRSTNLSAVDLVGSLGGEWSRSARVGRGGAGLFGEWSRSARVGRGGAGLFGDPPSERTASRTPLSHRDSETTALQPVLGSAAARLIGSTPVGTATSVVLPGATAASPASVAEPAHPAGATRAVTDPGAVRPDGAVRGLIASLGVAGRAADPAPRSGSPNRVAPVIATLDALPRSVAGWLHTAAEPVDAVLDAAASPLTGAGPLAAPAALELPLGNTLGSNAGRAQSGRAQSGPVPSGRVPSGLDAPAGAALTAGPAVRQARTGSHRGGMAAEPREWAVKTAGKPDEGSTGKPAAIRAHRTGTTDVPVGPLPAPTRGWAPGGSTHGSSVSSESGGYAVASNTIATGAAAVRRSPVAAEVEVARLDAEAPTVSPD